MVDELDRGVRKDAIPLIDNLLLASVVGKVAIVILNRFIPENQPVERGDKDNLDG